MSNAEKKRTLAVIGHGSAGKTSLVDCILFNAKVSDRLGKVDAGTSMADYEDDEKKRKITIHAKSFLCMWKDTGIVITDTPGYADFYGDLLCVLRITDGAVVAVDGVHGVEVGTQKVWSFADQHALPRIVLVTKLDKENADFFSALESLTSAFGKKCIPLQVPIGKTADFTGVVNLLDSQTAIPEELKGQAAELKEKLIEAAAEADDSLTERYLEEGTLSEADMLKGLRLGVLSGDIVPVLCGSAEKNIGTDLLLDAIADFLPSPKDRGEVKDKDEKKSLPPDPAAPFSALVFKTVNDPYVGQLVYLRIYSGTLKAESEAKNSTQGHRERIGQLLLLQGREQQQVKQAIPGDIIALVKLKNTSIGNTLCAASEDIVYAGFSFPKSVFSFAVHPKSKGDEEKISIGLQRIQEEDPTFKVERNVETKELVISGMGDLHLEVIIGKLKNRYGVDVTLSTPKVAYKETIKAKAEGHEKHKKQSGGRGQYGEVYLKLEPMERGAGFEFVDKIVGGAIPKNFIPAVQKGVVGAMTEGVLAGYPVVDVRTIVYDGSFHTVDSSELAFKIAGSKAFRDAMDKAKPIILEPIMNVEITVPIEYMGDVTGELNSKRGRIMGMDVVGGFQKIKATAPLAELFKFATELKSITGGRGSFQMEFYRYEEAPANVVQKIAEMAKKEAEAAKK